MDTDDLERLTLLERAQLLHDATLRRHGDMLNRLEEARVQHAARLTALADLAARQERLLERCTALAEGLLERQDAQTARLEGQAERLAQHEAHLALLSTLAAQHQERMDRLQQTLDVIKDMLDRGNGH
jgi:chromosome segregation ATPase